MSFDIRPPNGENELQQYFEFRWEQLRKPLGFKQGSEQDEFEEHSFQMAAFKKKKIIGVGRLQINSDSTARIRYMAVEKTFRKQRIGSTILENLESFALDSKVTNCWLLARETAIIFILKNNYKIIESAETELPVPQVRMQKLL